MLFGLWLAHELRFGSGPEQIRWNFTHGLLAGRLDLKDPSGAQQAQAWDLDATLYQGAYRRHSAEPYWVLPTTPPKRFFFPFDVGIGSRFGRIRLKQSPGTSDSFMRLEVADARVLLDPWRAGRPGCHLELGIGVRYSLDLDGPTGNFGAGQTVHRIAPLTATSLHFGWQDRSGLTHLQLEGHVVPHWASRGGWATGSWSPSTTNPSA